MKTVIEKRQPQGPLDYVSLAITTFGVGYLPLAPGTWGSIVGVAIYLAIQRMLVTFSNEQPTARLTFEPAFVHAASVLALVILVLIGIWASGRSTEMLGSDDPSEAVIDEIVGQLITFLFIPITLGLGFIVAGFLLFRLFDIWKPYPIDSLQNLSGGLGICADDVVAGVYAGVCLSLIYAFSLLI